MKASLKSKVMLISIGITILNRSMMIYLRDDESDFVPDARGDTCGVSGEWSRQLSKIKIDDSLETLGLQHYLEVDVNHLITDYFYLLIPEFFFAVIVDQTNLCAEQIQAQKVKSDDLWRPVSLREIKGGGYKLCMGAQHAKLIFAKAIALPSFMLA